jgi:hypothetical protein
VRNLIRRGLVVLVGVAVLFTAAIAFAAGNPIAVAIKTGGGQVTVKPPAPGQCLNGAGHAHQTYTGIKASVKLASSDATLNGKVLHVSNGYADVDASSSPVQVLTATAKLTAVGSTTVLAAGTVRGALLPTGVGAFAGQAQAALVHTKGHPWNYLLNGVVTFSSVSQTQVKVTFQFGDGNAGPLPPQSFDLVSARYNGQTC